MRKKLLTLFILLPLYFSAFPGLTQTADVPSPEPAPNGKQRALLIGCDHFLSQEDTWPAAENNLRMLSDTLISDVRQYALIRARADSISSVSAFEEAVLGAFQDAQPQDTSLLYISTHGVFEENGGDVRAGLLLSDGQTEELLDAPTLQSILDRVSGTKVIILDACNSGAMIGKGLSDQAARAYLSGPDYKVLCSAGGSEASWYFHGAATPSAQGASYFATVLCQGLGLLGDYAADRNADGKITQAEAAAYLLDNYAASTPQSYPQEEDAFVLYAYDPERPQRVQKAVTDLTFEETLLTAGQSEASFSFTVHRQVELYYQIIYHRNGAWQFGEAQHYLDGEQADGTVLPGRKARSLSLQTEGDASGYVILQLITLEDGMPVFQGGRLLCVQPASGGVSLEVEASPAFLPAVGQELPIVVRHSVPCGLTVTILNEERRIVRRLSYEAPTRPQQLTPTGSTFYWDGKLANGETAPPGEYFVQARTRVGSGTFTAESGAILLLSDLSEWEVLP